ncbi:MAG: cobalt-precorrin-5B (C(1))-methyltransferase CbiD, partial [Oscillospiraceae bacterium]
MDIYTYVGEKKMKLGYTTGSCAAAAAKASAKMLFSREIVKHVSLLTPKGIMLDLEVKNPVIEKNSARCEIIKHGGDDPDITDGIGICCCCEKNDRGVIEIQGGEGIGVVTRKGLSLDVGEYAINKTPREMIERALNEVRWDFDENCGLTVTITVPEGREVAKKTYNPKLGILDGISIIGTSGIVMPMSTEAIIKTI